ncbi:hypothetical protein TWF569_011221 [Orbilia oligospora]|uniref:Ribosomal RNA-processing protein 14/surfeit locus protein 6 C-terminal domain-containing protein n=1 Tax=Orbilia oligospora TaxID=2813651 RepID=A0A7C8JIF2_ORBOL|nr:hypothetical protein TWF706_008359 [Orbilia oligospora]KAF3121862.1 hypothetical protein TWF594_003086 [Orbilia oligospora]KAF3125996.1 hypothetical protein TWF703_010643 [Orbilia oligospora]KAF3131357.1 hypothetical protein TWF569_011221 [Orbilia oligospora]
MSEKDIEDRLVKHARAFDSLLNLIPAKLYFTQDNSDQWKKRKQTKEESQAAKRAKLDPDQAVTVKEVEDERSRERTAREEKRRKLNEDGLPYETKSQMKARKKEEKRRERRQNKESGGGKKKKDSEKQVQAEAQGDDEDDDMVEVDGEEGEEKPTPKKASHPPKSPSKQSTSPKKEQHHPAKRKDVKPNGVQIKVNGTEKTGKASIIQKPTVESSDSSDDDDDEDEDEDEGEEEEERDITAEMDKMAQDSESSGDDSEDSDSEGETIQRIPGLAAEPTTTTTTTSSPSPAPSNTTDTSTTQKTLAEKLKTSKDPLVQQQLKERLAKRIEELRHARKADGGEVPRTRTELMDQRRKRDEQRKERKKQMRLQAKVEAERAAESTDGKKKSESKKHNGVSTAPANYTFGNVDFEDGAKLTANLEGIKAAGKKRGPSDVLGALKHAEAKKARLAGMSDEKRAGIQEKDRWSKALKMASGEKLQDDEGLLKKSLKRQDKAKKKSEREWKERNDNVEKGKAMRQKKREANLAARREQKKAGKGGKKARKVPSKKSKGRAGFEGTGFGGAGKKKR